MHARILGGLSLCLVVSLSGCGSPGHVRHQDPRFTHDRLVDGKLGIIGVASRADPEISRIVGIRLGADLAKVLSRDRPEIPLVPAGTVLEVLGENRHLDLLDGLGRTRYRDWHFEDLRGEVPDPEFWVLARIVEDEVSQSYASTFDDGIEDDPEFERWETTRNIRVVFYVYDTTADEVVFIVSCRESETKTKAYEEYEDLLADLLIAAKSERGYPRPATLASLMERACGQFASALPHGPTQ